MGRKLVALDCDNTLLDKFGNICDINKKVIKKLRGDGVDFILATGRSAALAKDYAEELELNVPVISCNGAVICDLYSDRIYSLTAINKTAVASIFDYFAANDLLFKIFTPNACYTNDKTAMQLGLAQITKNYTRVLKYSIPYHFTEDMNTLRHFEDIVKVVFIDDDEAKRLNVQKELSAIPGINVHTAGFNCVDTIAKSASKGGALKDYAIQNGIKREDIIAFGDGENDLSMIEYAGIGAAMINGDEKLKKAADIVTEYDNSDGGVGRTLAKIFGLQL